LHHGDFEKKIVGRKRSSRKHRSCVEIFNRSGTEVCDDGSKAKARKVDECYMDDPYENSVHDCLRADQNIDVDGSSSLPPKHNTLVPSISVEGCRHLLEEYYCGA